MDRYRTFCIVGVLALVTVLGSGCSEARKSRRLAAAEKHFQAQDYAKAEIEFQSARQISQMDPVAISRLGEIYYIQGKYGFANAFLQKAIDTNPGDTRAVFLLAKTKTAMGRAFESYALAKKVLAREPANLEALVLAADNAAQAQLTEVAQLLDATPANVRNTAGWHTARGMLLAKSRRLDDALKELRLAVEASPSDFTAHQALGTVYFLRGDLTNAGASLHRAAEAAPPRSSVQVTRIEFVRRAKGDAEGLRLAEALVSKAPDFVPALVSLAEIHGAMGHKAELSNIIDKILATDPTNFKGLVLKGSAMIMNRDTNAVAYFERMAEAWRQNMEPKNSSTSRESATTNAPKSPTAATGTNPPPSAPQIARAAATNQQTALSLPPIILQKLAESYLLVGDESRALTYLDRAVTIDPGGLEAIVLRDAVRMKRGGSDLDAAVKSLEALLIRAPALENVRMLLAEGYKLQQKPQKAAEIYEQVFSAKPPSVQNLLLLAEAYIAQTNYAKARATLQRAGKTEDSSNTILELLTRIDIKEGNSDAALQRIREELSTRPNSAPLHYLEAYVLMTAKIGTAATPLSQTSAVDPALLQQVEKSLRQAVGIDPLYKPAVISLSDIISASGQPKRALEQLNSYLSKTNDADALMRAGLLHEQIQDKSGAAAAYEKLLALVPGNAIALNNLAAIYTDDPSKIARAVELARRAYQVAPAFPEIADTLAWASFKQGDYDEALRLAQQAMQGRPGKAEIIMHAGLAHYMLGNEAEAAKALAEALKIQSNAPSHELAQAALDVMAIDPANPGNSALPKLEQRLAAVPNDVAALKRAAAVYTQSGQWEKAAAAYQQHAKSARANPQKAESMIRAAEISAERLNKPAQALELGKNAVALDPQNPVVSRKMGRLLYQSGDPAWAAALLDEAARRENNPEIFYELSLAFHSMGNLDDAKRTASRAQSLSKSAPSTNVTQFLQLLAASSNPSNALQAVPLANAALKAEPAYLPALFVLALSKEASGQAKSAIEDYDRILTKFPLFTPAATRALLLNAKAGNNERVIALANKYKDLASNEPEAAAMVGQVAFKRGDFQLASTYLQRSDSTNPTHVAYLQLARHRLRQKVDFTALQDAIKAGLPKDLEAQARQALPSPTPAPR